MEYNLQELIEYGTQLDCIVKCDEPLKNHTSFRIGGNCRAFLEISSTEALRKLVLFCQKKGYPYTVLGNGSNILAMDSGYDGVVLHLGSSFSEITQEGTILRCQAGATLARIGRYALDQSLTGMECLAGIPGTVGGGLYMNAGAYGGEMADVVLSATFLRPDGTIETVSKAEMQLGYRDSVFRHREGIIVEVTLQLHPGSYGEIKTEMDGLLAKRKAKQPLELPSAGSTFQRPVGSYASLLIDQCGLKGASVGDAQVSTKHAGFVVNTGKATCHDVLELCAFVQQTVKEKTGYQLELEPVILGKEE